MVGTGNNEEFLKKFSYKNNLSNDVEFLGWRDDIGELLNLSDICVASSIREGLGINLIEAMYMNLPIVASNNRGHKELIENNVNGFLVDNYKEMYEKICLIIDDENIRNKFSCHNVQKYEDEYIALKICSLLNEFNK